VPLEKRILVISPNWIGDAVMAQPLLQLLRGEYPEAPIDVLAPPAVSPVWRQMAEVDEVLETPFRHGALQLGERWRYARMLRSRGYFAAYVLPNTLKYALIPWLAGIARRVGYKGESRYGLINVMHHDAAPPRPMVPFYAALAFAPSPDAPQMDGAPATPSWRTPSGQANAPRVPQPRLAVSAAQIATACGKAGLDADRPLIVFAPGAEFGSAKRWPAGHFADLAREVFAQVPGAQVALLGGPKDRDVCESVRALAPGALNLAGKTSLGEAVALIARADAVVSNDSGLLHIASALNRPVIAIYGPTDPDHAPPFSDIAVSISLRLDCSPCRQRECPLGHHNCMRGISGAQVWQTLQPMLGRA